MSTLRVKMEPQPIGTDTPGVYPDRYNHGPRWAFWLPDNRMTEPRTWLPPHKPGDVVMLPEEWRADFAEADIHYRDGTCNRFIDQEAWFDSEYRKQRSFTPTQLAGWSPAELEQMDMEGDWQPAETMPAWAIRPRTLVAVTPVLSGGVWWWKFQVKE